MEDNGNKEHALEAVVNWIIKSNPVSIKNYVDRLRSQNIDISNSELAKKIVSRKALKNGLIGAATGVVFQQT